MKVEKYDALGNEFFVIVGGALPSRALTRALCSGKASCDTQCNTQADGIIHLTYSARDSWRMSVFNCDGSDGGFSGNGLRCAFVALQLLTTNPENVPEKLVIHTKTNRAIGTVVPDSDDNTSFTVKTAISLPPQEAFHTIAPHIHADIVTKLPEMALEKISYVDIGNPHLILRLTADSKRPDTDHHETLDILRQSDTIVPGGMNVSVIQKQSSFKKKGNQTWNITTYERGVGLTKSCGSAAIAAFLSLSPHLQNQPPTCFSSEGGTLEIEQSQEDILITGKVKKSFSGDYDMGNNRLIMEIT